MEIAELIAHPEQLDKETLHGLRELVAQYPYYQTARLLFLKNLFLLHDPLFGEELRKAALFLPDRRVIFSMVEGGNYTIQPTPLQRDEAPAAPAADRTESLIDDFLRTAADESQPTARRKLTAADATTDYAAFLLQMDDAEPAAEAAPGRSDTLINDFIENKPERIQLQDNPEFTPEIPAESEGHEEQAELPGPAGKGGGKEGGGEPADGYTADELADFARGKEAAHAPKDERAGHNEQQGGELGAEGHRLSPGEGAQVVDDVGLTDGQVEIEKKEQEEVEHGFARCLSGGGCQGDKKERA